MFKNINRNSWHKSKKNYAPFNLTVLGICKFQCSSTKCKYSYSHMILMVSCNTIIYVHLGRYRCRNHSHIFWRLPIQIKLHYNSCNCNQWYIWQCITNLVISYNCDHLIDIPLHSWIYRGLSRVFLPRVPFLWISFLLWWKNFIQ